MKAAAALHDVLGMLSSTFGIPLSVTALATGVALGLGSRWGVLRHWWTVGKLALLVSVMTIAATVIGSAETALVQGNDATARSRRGGGMGPIQVAALEDPLPRSLRRTPAHRAGTGAENLVGAASARSWLSRLLRARFEDH